MDSYREIETAMLLIQDLSKDNINQIYKILQAKLSQKMDVNFAIMVLPTLIVKLKIYSFSHQEDEQIIKKINNLINNFIPLLEIYFERNKYEERQQKAYFKIFELFAIPSNENSSLVSAQNSFLFSFS